MCDCENCYKEIKDGIKETVSFKPLVWEIHIAMKFLPPWNYEIDGVYFSMVPKFTDIDFVFADYFCRGLKEEMFCCIKADTSFEAYKKAVNRIMDEFERYGNEYPVYLTALKHIELVSEEEVQKIVAENKEKAKR